MLSRSSILRSAMAQSSRSNIVEGIFAIHKPQGITSAAVIRNLESHFNPSKLFAPWLESERSRLRAVNAKKRRINNLNVKLGHGGTLDPLATGVLIVGVGSGTKALHGFLGCTKSYECVLLFGCATDSYDIEGKIVGRAPYEHLTREKVENALEGFRGKLMQKPPIFSALRVGGKRMHEYAREGGEIPELKPREVECLELEMVEWLAPGSHQYCWPEEEAPKEEKLIADKMMHSSKDKQADNSAQQSAVKRKIDDVDEPQPSSLPATKKLKDSPEVIEQNEQDSKQSEPEANQQEHMNGEAKNTPEPQIQSTQPSTNPSPPAVRLKMTVTSGFYVRSLCHDLGLAVGSMGIMSSLVRSRQGEFELGKNVLEYDELAKGEDVWAPKVTEMLDDWVKKEATHGKDA